MLLEINRLFEDIREMIRVLKLDEERSHRERERMIREILEEVRYLTSVVRELKGKFF